MSAHAKTKDVAYHRFLADAAFIHVSANLGLPGNTVILRLMNANLILVYEVWEIFTSFSHIIGVSILSK